MGAIYIEYSVEWCPLEVCNMAVSIDYFPYARHQNDLHVVSHFDIMTNHVVGISIYFIDKETNKYWKFKLFTYGNTTSRLQKQDSNSELSKSKTHIVNCFTILADAIV